MNLAKRLSNTFSQYKNELHQHGAFWIGATLVGLLAVFYAQLIDWGYSKFVMLQKAHFWLPLIITPLITASCVWLTHTFFSGSEGSGIPQVIAALEEPKSTLPQRLMGLPIIFGKILVSFIAILGGLTIGREGPTVQVGAALMYNLRKRFPNFAPKQAYQFILAGASAGLSAAFNTPLAGIVFAIEELTRSFESKTSGVLITAIMVSGFISLGINGDYSYFGTINTHILSSNLIVFAILLTGIITGIAGGVFCWILLNTEKWMPKKIRFFYREKPVIFALICGFIVAILGILSSAATFGSGYAEARNALNQHPLSVFYPFAKALSMLASYLPGFAGGLFSPSLSIGAGFGNLLYIIFEKSNPQVLIALGMVGYLAAVTQSPITSFVIVMEMINGHALLLSLMATALISSNVSKLFTPPLYETIAQKYLKQLSPPTETPITIKNR